MCRKILLVLAASVTAVAPSATAAAQPQVEIWWQGPTVYAVEQVVIGADDQLYHRYRCRAGFWGPWSLLPGQADPAGGITSTAGRVWSR